ncbi:MAG: CDP-6-deoxy-delta-3,4-glucoseen reductase [Gammaproteobacteria bacterium]|nr:CDP-6-deoxy-delta-3,4-glucoseen reductase [Gammaproteobacteria bacterium]
MSFTIHLLPGGREFTAEGDETILDAALRNGLALPYGCRGGACGACRAKLLDGSVRYLEDPMALSEAEQADRLSLLCVASATSDLTVEIKEVGEVEQIPVRNMVTKVARMERLNDEVMSLHLTLPEGQRLQFLAGQYVEFILKDGRRRAFSIANAPHNDQTLEFHIRHIEGGAFTTHLFDETTVGEILRIEGPLGSFFLREESERPIIMLATGTGFGPVKGIIEHAIAEHSHRRIYLYWGARTQAGLYMHELAQQWGRDNANIEYRPVLSRPDAQWEGRTGYVQDAVLADFADFTSLHGFELYACGHPQMVHSARAALVARGVESGHCYADAFEWAKS